MQWGSLENFLEMGGYGFFVWSSYGMCVAIVVAELVMSRARRQRALREVARESQLAAQRAAAAQGRS
jgi:heme exporter protein D